MTLTFVVSSYSFAYEFIYSELLMVMYGGTITQYIITVGLYFFGLGIGAVLSNDLDSETLGGNFFRTKVLLAVAAPTGFPFIVGLNNAHIPQAVPAELVWTITRLLVVVVGFPSGFELLLLTRMFGDLDDDGSATPSWLRTADTRVHNFVMAAVGTLWTVGQAEGRRSGLSVVLVMDYVGDLADTVVYARVLYPGVNLIPTIFVLAPLNGVVALVFVARFDAWSWWPLGGDEAPASAGTGGNAAASARINGSDRSPSTARVPKTLLVTCLLLTTTYAGVVARHDTTDERLSQLYLKRQVENEYPSGAIHATVTSRETTAYQHVIRYDRTWTDTGPNPHFDGRAERCLCPGAAVQLCKSWADSYHEGLVDVPMSLVDPSPDTKVPVVGGSDWIAVDHLRGYGVTVDHVDLDSEFIRDAKTDLSFARWHDDVYECDWLNATVADGYRYLQKTNETYDFVLLDIPDTADDGLLTLYSTRFYRSVRAHLSEDGVAATQGCSPDTYLEYHKAFVNTAGAAGFTRELSYWVREDPDDDGETRRVEQLYILASGGCPRLTGDSATQHVRAHEEHYGAVKWHAVPHCHDIRKDSIFHPNYDILVDA